MAESPTGRIVAGALSPHPPHLVYAENPPQNEPSAECGWEGLRWGYERLRRTLDQLDIDVIVVHSPHWKTSQGHHVLGVPEFKSLSVDPIFPHLFRFHYDLSVDVELAEAIAEEGQAGGLAMHVMRNPDFRVDYGTITSCQLTRPAWDLPIVAISSSRVYFDFNNDVGDRQMVALGRATRRAIERTGRRALLLASNSLSHRHFTQEPEIPEDMSHERIYHHGQYLWDMHVLDLMRRGRTRQLMAEMPDYIEHATSECKDGSLSWLLGAMEFPDYPAEVHAYGTVIGTGNAIVGWIPPETAAEVAR
ncbi:MAG: tRNA U-34 5-methylaminomethyl-2-thiouridine biosynthesis protein [Deltaproteobacteria bacterium]|nr:tRNA U-34 5-methylaminomethyl-2-thiouridine biosynthesis protein [Deltaproteobacteria bacterium]HCH63984.1 tRNA U-34 5-methylaminomethyl-2-thiouridine biosynthesis protein [Deltaproteobacteria bacterium]